MRWEGGAGWNKIGWSKIHNSDSRPVPYYILPQNYVRPCYTLFTPTAIDIAPIYKPAIVKSCIEKKGYR